MPGRPLPGPEATAATAGRAEEAPGHFPEQLELAERAQLAAITEGMGLRPDSR